MKLPLVISGALVELGRTIDPDYPDGFSADAGILRDGGRRLRLFDLTREEALSLREAVGERARVRVTIEVEPEESAEDFERSVQWIADHFTPAQIIREIERRNPGKRVVLVDPPTPGGPL